MESFKRHYVIGTAGHIDHGKTAMVKQLTGRDTDWLKEEKARGMTIDLGFAFLGENITIIDVPGHEKFIRNMVAGVSTIDLVLLVIAADDGIMPQTREHFDILKLLQIKNGIVVITKIDLAEKDWLDLVIDDVKEFVKNSFLENAPIVPISSVTGEGIEDLREQIMKSIAVAPDRQSRGIFRLPVDRIFTIKGFGTIVAGTVFSGNLQVDQTVELLPQGAKLRVRNLQIHEQNVSSVKVGDRAALNLVGIEKEAVRRGNVVAEPGFFVPTQFLDAKFYLLKSAPKPFRHNERVHLHVGTEEVIARVRLLEKEEILPGEESLIQMKLEKKIIADHGDRFVLRRFSPVETIGGGSIIDAHPRRHKRFSATELAQIRKLDQSNPAEFVEIILEKHGTALATIEAISRAAIMREEQVKEILHESEKKERITKIIDKGQQFFILREEFQKLKQKMLDNLEQFHRDNPARRGIPLSELKNNLKINDALLLNSVLETLSADGKISLKNNIAALQSKGLALSDVQKRMTEKIARKLYDEAFATSNPGQLADE
ncbi:MAG: selenocysteine-specific translation elongation factor, partial [Calditrichaeota bacterium]|nr:selenocysteine-specific translation elongation factor [Calditrichota bacterium]